MRKKKVDCPGIVKAIRKEYNDIVWVSASIDGSRLKIQIKENEDTFQEEMQGTEEVSEKPTDLIAEEDGVITGIITRSGVPQVISTVIRMQIFMQIRSCLIRIPSL